MEDETMWKKMEKEAVSPVIGVILMVAITVVLAAVLYVWVTGMAPTGPMTPSITVSTVDTAVDSKDNNVSCMVAGISRADVKWDDIDYTVLVNESIVSGAKVTHAPADDKYVSGGYTLTYKSAKLGDTTRVKVTIVYRPSGSTMGAWSMTCT